MDNDYLDYAHLIDKAMHSVVKESLRNVARYGLYNDHHFFITFETRFPGVMVSDEIRQRYPEDMTIVIQHQFWDLEVDEDRFSIVLSFDNTKQSLTIPFDSLISFADPSVRFGLQFSSLVDGDIDDELQLNEDESPKKSKKNNINNVVTLDTFRKNKD